MTRWLGLVLAALMTLRGAAQAPSFEVASIRPSATGVGGPVGASFTVEPGGRLLASGATLRDLVVRAYGAQDFQLVGGDRWVSSVRFDVTAKAASGTNPNGRELNAMLLSLLRERFGLQVRRETRNVPIFSLVLVSRRPGPRLQLSVHDCRGVLEGRDPFDVSPIGGALAECQPRTLFTTGRGGAQVSFTRVGLSMPQLASMLAPFAKRTVVDRTALRGTYDIGLTFSPEGTMFVTQDGIQQAPQMEGSSLATALREQLGLRLESGRGPSEVLVIEAAHQPAPD